MTITLNHTIVWARDKDAAARLFTVVQLPIPVDDGKSTVRRIFTGGRRVGFAPTGKRRLVTAHTRGGH
jgi:hypothetical protein